MTTEDYNNLCASVMKMKDDFDAQFAKIEADLLRIADGNILQERADESIRAILPNYPVGGMMERATELEFLTWFFI